jgi:putative ATP-binding cassette transporter
MGLLGFIARESGAQRGKVLAAALASGLANGLFIAILNTGAAHSANDEFKLELAAAALLAVTLYALLQHFALGQAVAAAETALLRVRLRIIGKASRCSLRFVETDGDIGRFVPLSEDAGLISQGALSLAAAAQGMLTILFAVLYLAWLSPLTCVLALILYAILLPLSVGRQRRVRTGLGQAAAGDARFYDRFAGLLAGFKELKLNRPESDALFADIRRGTDQAFELKLNASHQLARSIAYGYAVPVLVVFAGVFVAPELLPEGSETVHKVAATILFMNAPVGVLVNAVSMLARIDAAIARLDTLERQVELGRDPADGTEPAQPELIAGRAEGATEPMSNNPDQPSGFERIGLAGARFSYLDAHGWPLFDVGPIDLEIRAGELLFIVGGNGSGKSTLLKLLTGLYPLHQGELLLDGRRVQLDELARYRALFTTLFTDFHLFRRLYGIQDLDPAAVDQPFQGVDTCTTATARFCGVCFPTSWQAAADACEPLTLKD